MNDNSLIDKKMNILKTYVNEYKELCFNSNEISQDEESDISSYTINGWVDIVRKYDKKSQFKAVAYSKNNKIVVAYVGTNFKSLKDIITDLRMLWGPTKQMLQANEFYNMIKDRFQNAEIILTGHSEGGSEAQYVCIKNGGIPTFTFNPYMIGGLFSKEVRDAMLPYIYNYRHKRDIVSRLGKDIGYQFIAKTNKLTLFRKSHQIESIKDATNVILAKSSAYNLQNLSKQYENV